MAGGLFVLVLMGCAEITPDSEKIEPHYEKIDGALMYDYDPTIRLARGLDGYSHNVVINKYNEDVPNELMVLFSIAYEYEIPIERNSPYRYTNSYVFFIKPLPE